MGLNASFECNGSSAIITCKAFGYLSDEYISIEFRRSNESMIISEEGNYSLSYENESISSNGSTSKSSQIARLEIEDFQTLNDSEYICIFSGQRAHIFLDGKKVTSFVLIPQNLIILALFDISISY